MWRRLHPRTAGVSGPHVRAGEQALPALEVVRVLRTVGHKRTGLKPPPHFTQAIEQPSAGNDFPSLLTWARLEPGNEMLHSPRPVLLPIPPLYCSCFTIKSQTAPIKSSGSWDARCVQTKGPGETLLSFQSQNTFMFWNVLAISVSHVDICSI